MIGEEYRNICPACGREGGWENIGHIILRCPRWDREREVYLGRIIRDLRSRDEVSDLQLVVLLLGGSFKGHEYSYRVKSWLPTSRTRSQPSSSLDEVSLCTAFKMARFLQSISSDRAKVWSEICGNTLRQSRSPTGYPMAAVPAEALLYREGVG